MGGAALEPWTRDPRAGDAAARHVSCMPASTSPLGCAPVWGQFILGRVYLGLRLEGQIGPGILGLTKSSSCLSSVWDSGISETAD